MTTIALLSTTYFGPIQWYQKLYRSDRVLIEQYETFQKQTFRNRCVIASANGPLMLTVPVERSAGSIRDMRISDHGNWRHLHWHALLSAYGDSPFFEYYQDDLHPFFERRWSFLFDFNEAIRETLCPLLDIHPTVSLTAEFVRTAIPASSPSPVSSPSPAFSPSPASSPLSVVDGFPIDSASLPLDFRNAIRPKHPLPDASFSPRPYYQVYSSRHGFLPNLSILDLLFNMGPESIFYL